MERSGLMACFESMTDPRINRTRHHDLTAIVVIAICAVICGADTWVAIAEYGEAKKRWFESFLDLKNGIPSHDTFGRVFAALDPTEFGERFITWVSLLANNVCGDIIAIDGKTLRKSFDTASSKSAIHMVSAWSDANQLVLGQIKVDEKSNEITAIPALLEMLVLEKCIVTIDAMGCQKAIVEKIIEKEADYVIALKGNQGTLHQEVIDYFDYAESKKDNVLINDHYDEVDAGHGRIETRSTKIITDVSWFENRSEWKELNSIIKVEAMRENKLTRKKEIETRYYISSLKAADAQKAHQAVRKHWGVENGLHWCLDVSFSEDDSRVREGYADQNLSVLRRIALNLLKQETSSKVGIQTKRLRAGWDERYLLKVLKI
jgi:predicted transposase YbfD/YdcC